MTSHYTQTTTVGYDLTGVATNVALYPFGFLGPELVGGVATLVNGYVNGVGGTAANIFLAGGTITRIDANPQLAGSSEVYVFDYDLKGGSGIPLLAPGQFPALGRGVLACAALTPVGTVGGRLHPRTADPVLGLTPSLLTPTVLAKAFEGEIYCPNGMMIVITPSAAINGAIQIECIPHVTGSQRYKQITRRQGPQDRAFVFSALTNPTLVQLTSGIQPVPRGETFMGMWTGTGIAQLDGVWRTHVSGAWAATWPVTLPASYGTLAAGTLRVRYPE